MKLHQRFVCATLVLFIPIALPSCSSSIESDCTDLCERGMACPGFRLNIPNCEEQCERLDELADAADCVDQTEAYMECAVGIADVCQIGTACQPQGMAYYGCAKPYCDANPTADECRSFTCTYGGGGSEQTCRVHASCTGSPRFELDCVDGACTCKQDDAPVATVAFQEVFCSEQMDDALTAAQAACGWSF